MPKTIATIRGRRRLKYGTPTAHAGWTDVIVEDDGRVTLRFRSGASDVITEMTFSSESLDAFRETLASARPIK